MRIVWRLLQSRVLAAAILGAALLKIASDGFYLVVGVHGVNLDVDIPSSVEVTGSIDIDLGNQSWRDKDGKAYVGSFEIRHSGSVGGR